MPLKTWFAVGRAGKGKGQGRTGGGGSPEGDECYNTSQAACKGGAMNGQNQPVPPRGR